MNTTAPIRYDSGRGSKRPCKRVLVDAYQVFSSFLFDPVAAVRRWRAIPHFIGNAWQYRTSNRNPKFHLRFRNMMYTSYERFGTAGSARGHYFHQDLWAARELYRRGVVNHVDVGSRLDGFVAHVLPFCEVTYVDLRPLEAEVPGLHVRLGSITELPFADDSLLSLSCLHVIEHIGLGRYGDPVDPQGYADAARELSRVLAPEGILLLGTPVGRERLCFDAHRVFDPETVTAAFPDLELLRFDLIDDAGECVVERASFDVARRCEYACGLFVFQKPAYGVETSGREPA